MVTRAGGMRRVLAAEYGGFPVLAEITDAHLTVYGDRLKYCSSGGHGGHIADDVRVFHDREGDEAGLARLLGEVYLVDDDYNI